MPVIPESSIMEVESTLTDRYQTTVPETVRRALNLTKRDKIHYTIRQNGEVLLTRADTPIDDDPVLSDFLDFLAADMMNHPGRLQALDGRLVRHVQSLVAGIDINLDQALPEDDE
ncbi:MAG: type II toxin-antitoxin system PrlF family antitoxin [Pseudohongiella sp.]|nr:type II toxin-antitoxin system PrlF family antitoxin [Pseudohongiella sp.]